jgi:hypothetical protein
MKKLFIFYNFVILTVMTAMGFLGALSYAQLIPAILFFPLAIYFFLMVIPTSSKSPKLPTIKELRTSKAKPVIATAVVHKEEDRAGVDKNRRMFLKLIGSAGLSLFLFSVFTKKAEAAFFGSAPGPGTVAIKNSSGVQIDPAEKQPTDGYKITEVDDTSVPAYYGYVDKTGAWFIMQEDASGHYRYARGTSDFTNAVTGWPNRASLTYGYFDATF